MKKKNIKRYMVLVLAILLIVLPGLNAARAHAAAAKTLEKITAFYMGGGVEVGKKIDPEKLYVEATYSIFNGYTTTQKTERVTDTKNFMIVPDTVANAGANTMVLIYEGKAAQFNVNGKTVVSIDAEYEGDEVTIGDSFSRDLITVNATYSDGSRGEIEDFFIYSTEVTVEGLNIFPVVYGDKYSYIYVMGVEPLKITELFAAYGGDDLVVGNYINKSDIDVLAFYNNGDMEEVEKFKISPETVNKEGKNIITVTYGDISTTIEIWAEKKEILSITAEYKGPGVIVGTEIDKNDVEVMATYNDGTTERTGDFKLSQTLITEYGENILFVYCDDFLEVISVNGVEGFVPSYDNSYIDFVFNKDYSSYSMVTIGMATGVEQGAFWIEPLDELIARRIVQRVVPTEEYIPFVIAYDDDEMVTKFPMAVKVTVPFGYDPEYFGVYYTPNQKSIMAKLDGEFTDEEKTEYQFIVYEPGAYVLIHEVKNLLVEEIVVKEEVTLAPNRNYSIKPVVLPKKAENRDVEYWSSDERIATVSERGQVRTLAEGTCEIWVKAMDGSGVYSIVTITVKDPRKNKLRK